GPPSGHTPGVSIRACESGPCRGPQGTRRLRRLAGVRRSRHKPRRSEETHFLRRGPSWPCSGFSVFLDLTKPFLMPHFRPRFQPAGAYCQGIRVRLADVLLVANRQRIAKFGGSFIRHRITHLNVGRSRHFRRRLVAVPACIAGRERRKRVRPEAGDRETQREFSRAICGVSHVVTGTDARMQAAEEREQTCAKVSPTAFASATNRSDALALRGDKY